VQNSGPTSKVRNLLAQYPTTRSLFGLHDTGDGKSDYLGKGYDQILLLVQNYTAIEYDQKLWTKLAEGIARATGKHVTIGQAGDTLPKNTAVLYIYIESENSEDPLTLGKTLRENGVILYANALARFTEQTPRTADAYTYSTLLHELGHQLGLTHNELPNCLMGSHAEVDKNAKSNPAEVITTFCTEELEELQSLKTNL
jgi:hypothetical protein